MPYRDASILGAAPQPSPGTVVDNIEQSVDPLQPRDTMPAAGIAAKLGVWTRLVAIVTLIIRERPKAVPMGAVTDALASSR